MNALGRNVPTQPRVTERSGGKDESSTRALRCRLFDRDGRYPLTRLVQKLRLGLAIRCTLLELYNVVTLFWGCLG